MLRLTQAKKKASKVGDPLFTPFKMNKTGPDFAHCEPRRGQLAMFIAPPGGGKSFFAQSLVQRGDGLGRKNKGIYFSADSDSFTMYLRAVAIETGWRMIDIERNVRSGDKSIDSIAQSATQNIWWCFTSSLTAEDIIDEFRAYAEINGEYPEFAVVDNLLQLDVTDGTGDDWKAGEEALLFLHEVAHETGAAIIVLHHVTGSYEEQDGLPIPLGATRGKSTKTPELVCSLWRTSDTMTNVSVVKARGGKMDPSGNFYGTVQTDLERGSFL